MRLSVTRSLIPGLLHRIGWSFPTLRSGLQRYLGRTKLLERPAIIAFVGGLPDQAGERDILFKTDAELVAAFQTAACDVPLQAHSTYSSSVPTGRGKLANRRRYWHN